MKQIIAAFFLCMLLLVFRNSQCFEFRVVGSEESGNGVSRIRNYRHKTFSYIMISDVPCMIKI